MHTLRESLSDTSSSAIKVLMLLALCFVLGCSSDAAPSHDESDASEPAVTDDDESSATDDEPAARDAGRGDAARPSARDARAEVPAQRDARVDATIEVDPESSDASAPATQDAQTDGALAAPVLPAVDSVDRDGPFATQQDLAAGPAKKSGLFHPKELGKDGLRHPIFLWGCGGSSTPSQYVDHMNRIASHGFVAIAEVSVIDGNGVTLKASLDWIIAENARPASPFYQKLDTTRIAMGGHSIGSVNTFSVAADPRLLTTIHVAGGSLDEMGGEARKLVHPVAYICSERDSFGNVEKAEADYAATTVPVFFTIMSGVDHIAAARQALPAIVAWLRWHVAGESERRAMFLSEQGQFRTGKFVSRSKNW